MKRRLTPSIISALTALWFAQSALAADVEGSRSVNMPVESLAFTDFGGGVQVAPLWGDMHKGAWGNTFRLPAGFTSPLHLHSAPYYGIVISGTVVNFEQGQQEIPMSAGSYWFQRGKVNHVTRCVSGTDCLIYLSMSAPHDFVVPKTK